MTLQERLRTSRAISDNGEEWSLDPVAAALDKAEERIASAHAGWESAHARWQRAGSEAKRLREALETLVEHVKDCPTCGKGKCEVCCLEDARRALDQSEADAMTRAGGVMP